MSPAITTGLSTDINAINGLATLYSKGVQLSYNVVQGTDADTLTATAGVGGTPVFTLVVNRDGTWSFDLDDQLDHVDDGTNTENTVLRSGTSESPSTVDGIDFSSILVGTATGADFDGDEATATVGVAAGSFVVTVVDDIPEVSITPVAEASVTAEVLEDGLSIDDGDPGDNSEGYRELGESLTSDEVSGGTNLTSLFTAAYAPIGADEDGTPLSPAITTGLSTDIVTIQHPRKPVLLS